MKYIFLSIILSLIIPSCVYAQDGEAIDKLFEKYSGKEGITSVYISSRMFSMFSSKDIRDEELKNLTSRLKSIRILAVEDSSLNLRVNFFEELRKTSDFSSYVELMVVNENNNITKFLVRESGNIIAELLIISGGNQGNTMISIKGDIDLKNISGLSRKMGLEQLGDLENLDQKQQKK